MTGVNSNREQGTLGMVGVKSNSIVFLFSLLFFVMLAGCAVYLAVRWNEIPERFANHWSWGSDGRADGWANRNVVSVFWPLAAAALIGAFMFVLLSVRSIGMALKLEGVLFTYAVALIFVLEAVVFPFWTAPSPPNWAMLLPLPLMLIAVVTFPFALAFSLPSTRSKREMKN